MTASDYGVGEAVAAMLHAIDNVDWDSAYASFAATVTIDYTSLWGGEPETLDAGELIMRWRKLLPGFDSTQHLLGPVVTTAQDEHQATCTASIRAYHHLADGQDASTWMVAGQYVMTLERLTDGWKIRGITLNVAYEEGGRTVIERAQERVAAGRGRTAAA
ncbi:nuclear transport factor 2 family protein [Phytoactinopolyspora endophytica]|uniref:nuclear transport factor 2 family protein n=1 Tax=Phytoactinopolyspora endophytica TaxID=1642495 RepID=UPI00197B5208|nr:nuclear transport factor 2 family protein [Phytoactinopolyspora endophytica]